MTKSHAQQDDALRELIRSVIEDELKRDPIGLTDPTLSSTKTSTLQKSLPPPVSARAIDHIVRANPARLVQGRTGTRYLTDVYVGLRADHAIALDAVHSEISDDFAQAQGWTPLRSRCADHQEFLLYPDHGRRLDEASKQILATHVNKNMDVQVIVGDGLSAYALQQNGPALVAAMQNALTAAGFRVAPPVFVKFARIGIQDEIGTLLSAKATAVIVGERPGLGTGDSLSIYTAYAPKLGQDNSEKDCISNVRSLGVSPTLAAQQCVDLLKRTFAAGGGGTHLVQFENRR